MRLDREHVIAVGALGRIPFAAGYYIYTGRAKKGLNARLARHGRQKKRMRWHIDYLLQHAKLLEVLIHPAKVLADDTECRRNQDMAALARSSVPVNGFGSSDCGCKAHLVYFQKRPGLSMPAP